MTVLKINNVTMPSPKASGFKVTEEKIWSKNTKRNNKGYMVGTIIAIKKTIDIDFPILTYEQVAKISAETSNKNKPFVPVYFNDGNGWEFTANCYFGSVPIPVYGTYGGVTKIDGYTLSAVER